MRFGFLLLVAMRLLAAETNLNDLTPDLVVPEVREGVPAAGQRVRRVTAGWEGTEVHHLLYLPTDWSANRRWPVLVEYAGNGGFSNALGDVSDGSVEGASLGYGLSGGSGFLWISMPSVEVDAAGKRNAVTWWGDVEETKRYCVATVKAVCEQWGGDSERVVLCGFSRGAIACNYLGLHDGEMAALWCGFFCHSHYDGVREGWPYAGADRAAALTRLNRLGGRPQWISHERSVEATRDYLAGTGVVGDWTFVPMPFPNHTDAWTLRDLAVRRQAREWLRRVVALP